MPYIMNVIIGILLKTQPLYINWKNLTEKENKLMHKTVIKTVYWFYW